jgi:MFS family permease
MRIKRDRYIRVLFRRKPHILQKEGVDDKIETYLRSLKLLFYSSILAGVIWNLFYFGLVVNVLPDFDIENLAVYLVAIFGIGFFMVFVFTLSFIYAGLMLRANKSKELDKWLKESRRNAITFYILQAVGIFISICIIIVFEDLSTYNLVLILFLILAFISLALLKSSVLKFSEKLRLIPNACWYSAITLFIIMVFILMGIKIESYYDKLFFGITLFSMLSLSAIFNGIVALEGLGFARITRNPNINFFIGFFVLLFIVSIIFPYMTLSNNPNPFLIAPYRLLRIGQVCASLTLDNDFVIDTHLTKKLELEKNEGKFDFKILSSIGTEYIVEYPSDCSKTTTNKNKSKNILRIPKNKILLVEY